MTLTRRELLAGAVGTGLVASTGCTVLQSTSVPTPGVSVESTTMPDALGSRFEFEVERHDGFSEAHPARVRMRLTRKADDSHDSASVLKFGSTPPFSYYNGAQADQGPLLMALPEDTSALRAAGRSVPEDYEWMPDEPEDGCWRSPVVPQVSMDVRTSIRLSPGESVSEEYALVGFGEQCLSEGTYLFRSHEPYHVSTSGRVEYSSADRWGLGFEVRLG